MSRFRGSPSRSPYRSPARLYETERDAIIEDQLRFQNALRADTDARRMADEVTLLQAKVRQAHEVEDRCEGLAKQNALLMRENEDFARQLNERRYENERLRAVSIDHQEREAIKNGQLYEMNKSLELEIELLKKEKVESARLFEAHIEKLERMLDEKVRELDISLLKGSDLAKELELTEIRFEEERNRLKNAMNRTEHELERELEYTKEKQTSEKFAEIDAMKRNHNSQVALLEDEIGKLKMLNTAKTQEFEAQLAENRNIRKRYDEELKALGAENDELRGRMLKLEEINRSEVENIQNKYNDYHQQGTSSLKEQHGREMKLLLDEIDKLKWLTNEKNAEIQNLVREKRELRRYLDEAQLEMGSEIDTLKNKLYAQQEKHAADSHALMSRINDLTDRLNRDAEGYHSRAKDFQQKMSRLENEVNDKQSMLDFAKGASDIREKELEKSLNDATAEVFRLKRELADSEGERNRLEKRLADLASEAEKDRQDLSRKLNEAEVRLEEVEDKLSRQTEENNGNEGLLRVEVESLRNTIQVLESKLAEEENKHAKEMADLSESIYQKVNRLQQAQRKALDELEESRKQEIGALLLRVEKAGREKAEAENQLSRYIEMYEGLEKYFKNPHDGALFEQKSESNVYEVLSKLKETSSINIF